jgi:Ca2+/Na+ antiporter
MIYIIISSINSDNEENDNNYFWVIIQEKKCNDEVEENNKDKDKEFNKYINNNTIKEESESKIFNEKEKDFQNIYIPPTYFEEFSNISIDELRKILKEKNENEIIDNIKEEDNKLITNKFDIEKYDYIRHTYLKNISMKINSYQSLIHLFLNGIVKVLKKPWELLVDSLVPKSNDGFSLIFNFFIQLFLIWNFSELEIYLLEKVISRLNIPASFLGLTIMSWGNNAPDM